ncbi:hypothetical protein CVT24_009642 [Panaeolus cyanescens]|uniref:Lysine-specific metallo-endopeptidase domain-containing protein n=1 Tax=Panaeolus cyanescens TaxID=181874 RepID=A0A409Y9I5_9AGAR|nr:hypothetical protein CVT24_009642 [Panaeolus cyanescens]
MKLAGLMIMLVCVNCMAFIDYATGAPLKLTFEPGLQGTPPAGSRYEKLLFDVLDAANKQIQLMKACIDAVVKRNDARELQKIKAVFGPNPNLKEIEYIINLLVIGTMTVDDYLFPASASEPFLAEVRYYPNTGRKALRFSDTFHLSRSLEFWKKVVILLHEASHWFGDTYDDWEWDHSSTILFPVHEDNVHTYSLDGSWNMYYNLVVKHGGNLIHKNAETWGIFGYYLEHGSFPPHNSNYVERPSPRPLAPAAPHGAVLYGASGVSMVPELVGPGLHPIPKHATCAPLKLTFKPGILGTPPAGSQYEKLIHQVLDAANKQIKLMKACIDAVMKHNDAAELQKIKAVFGPNPNLKEIERIIDRFVTGTMEVGDYDYPSAGTPDRFIAQVRYGYATPSGMYLFLSDIFHGATLDFWMKVLVLIHEASHWFADASDFWEWDHTSTVLFPIHGDNAHHFSLDGSWDMYYNLVVKHGGNLLHKNADTWGIFGYYLEHGKFPPHHPKYGAPKSPHPASLTAQRQDGASNAAHPLTQKDAWTKAVAGPGASTQKGVGVPKLPEMVGPGLHPIPLRRISIGVPTEEPDPHRLQPPRRVSFGV